jgi:hypothetical protein
LPVNLLSWCAHNAGSSSSGKCFSVVFFSLSCVLASCSMLLLLTAEEEEEEEEEEEVGMRGVGEKEGG